MRIQVFTEWEYPDHKQDGVRGTHQQWCEAEVERLAGHGRAAAVVKEVGGRLRDGVARVAAARVYQ